MQFKNYPDEKWEFLEPIDGLRYSYAISNYGRIMNSVTGKLIKPGKVEGYHTFKWKTKAKTGKLQYRSIMMHNLVADKFIKKPSDSHSYVIHLDRNKANNHFKNLKWVNREEMLAFRKESPAIKESIRKLAESNRLRDSAKLTLMQATLLKKKIFDPNRKTRYKMLAKQFGISEMQLYRIKKGECWGHIKI